MRIVGVLRTTFASYKHGAGRLDLDGIGLNDFRDHPLAPLALSGACATCMTWSTTPSTRSANLLLTSAHQDPETTSFPSWWVFGRPDTAIFIPSGRPSSS